jgi:YD repeat-containing protein
VPVRFRSIAAAFLSLAFVSAFAPVPLELGSVDSASAVISAAEAHSSTIATHTTVALAHPPTRIVVNEPRRVRPVSPSGDQWRPKVQRGTRPLNGMRVSGPPMLRPSEIDGVLRAAAHQRSLAAAASTTTVTAGHASAPAGRQTAPSAPGVRRTQSLPGNPTATGTGINPWWRYQEEPVPGGGHAMVNVGTGNLVLQDDDMAVPHKGIALAFRRTYNSQSGHDVNASDTGAYIWMPPGMYGNGWTSTFDAHLARTADNLFSVFDIDGTRYDFTNGTTPVPGNHTTLSNDGQCGILWTKKSGTVYYFYRPNPSTTCPNWPSDGGSTSGYAGRLYQIIGRNRNTFLTFSYLWDGGVATTAGKISEIDVATESGMTAKLSFADVNGHRLLQQLLYPDGVTAVQYGYDANGNLTTVSRPPNNASGVRPTQVFGYVPVGSTFAMQYAGSPRGYVSCQSSGGCYGDGGGLWFAYAGTSNQTATISSVQDYGSVNPTVADGVSTGPLQGAGYSSADYPYNIEYYTTGVTTPTYRDTAGHMTNWVVDGLGRPTQTQECTSSSGQGTQCTGQWLLLNESWDANDNLVSEVDARGYETDYAYDANANAIAVAAPQSVTSQGTFRPTKLYDYDAYNNVVAYCDEDETHRAGADWVTAPASSDTLCSSHAGTAHWSAAFTYPSYQPYGQLSSMTTPLGYTRHFTYSATNQGGADFGLPTAVSGDPITQRDGSTLTPAQTFWYDAPGNLRCYSKGNGTTVLSYDALGRLTSEADADDSSANSGAFCAKSTGQPGWNTQTTYTYFPDGSKASVQTPAERPYGVATSYTYDLDGNVLTEIAHHACIPNQTCNGATTQKWYDGADRLVEVGLPHDAADGYSTPWLTRYLYDLSQAGTVSLSTATFSAYGNLYKTQEYVAGTNGIASWTDQKGNGFDALDRAVAKYSFSPSSNTTLRTSTSAYDHDTSTLGLLWQTIDPLGEQTTYGYTERGATASVTFAGDGGVTPARTYVYDANGRIATRSSSVYGSETLQYDFDGRLSGMIEPSGGGVTSPATISYAYYGDGSRASIGVTSAAVTANPLITYDYRPDGRRTALTMTYAGITSPFSWTYTDAGRELTQNDPYTGTTVNTGGQTGPPPFTTVRPRVSSYDTTGQLASLSDPGYPNFASMTHDPEGSLTGYNSGLEYNSLGMVSNTGTVQLAYSLRGEAVSETASTTNTASTLIWINRIFNGAALPGTGGADGAGGSVDPINAAIIGTTQLVLCDPISKTHRTSSDTQSYDSAGRIAGRTIIPYEADCSSDPIETRSTSFDAENHTVGESRTNSLVFSSTTMGWGPNGHPIVGNTITGASAQFGPITYHYDGDHVLFVSDSQNRMVTLNAEQLGTAGWGYTANPPQGSNHLTVLDRDYAGVQVSAHDASGYAGWNFTSGSHRRYLAASRGGTPSPFEAPPTSSYSGAPSLALYVHPDGFEAPFGTVQGVRVSNDLGQWTSPDAYAGDVHDPMSQKAYAWNRNNPYQYSDPSGFVPTWDQEWDDQWRASYGFSPTMYDVRRPMGREYTAQILTIFAYPHGPLPDEDNVSPDARRLMATAACLQNKKSCDYYLFGSSGTPGADHGYRNRPQTSKRPALPWPTGISQDAVRIAIANDLDARIDAGMNIAIGNGRLTGSVWVGGRQFIYGGFRPGPHTYYINTYYPK